MNFARDIVEAAPPARRALVALDAAGARREISFGEVAERSARLAGALIERGVRRGHVVMTVIGSTPEWVLTLVACFRIGAVALPCTEQLRAGDLQARLEAVPPRLVVATERNLATVREAGFDGPLVRLPDESLFDAAPAAAVELDPEEPALITFTSGTAGEPKPIRHGQRYLEGQRVQAEHWLGARQGELVWCTAASGWSKSARNVFVAPWLRGAA
ncbi:MAG: acyl-CoA synthetase, partial [Thermoleophilaceae bacterium]|nr:acyl-CoA synthetase [Thermoleophilaceae bacterium]